MSARSFAVRAAALLFWAALTMLLSFSLSVSNVHSATATGTERPRGRGDLDALGPDGEPLGACPLEHTEVSADVAGFVARVRVTQTFRNPHPDPIEAVYTFPLSEAGAVDAMWIRTGEREIRGQIQRREEARRIYEEARERGQLAALLDQERPNIFTQRVANLMPGARIEIRIEYVEPLRFESGTFEFSFPMVVGPRFVPSAREVPDRERVTPPVTPEGTRAGHDVSLGVTIDAGVRILDLDSRLHEVDVDRPSEKTARVRLRNREEIPNRDFVLRYRVARDEIQSGFLVHAPGDRDGYVTFVLLPPERVTPRTAAPKEMIFVIDRSGSQSGLPLTKAKETMLWILDRMNPRDTFQVVDFSNRTNTLFDRPRTASPETKRRARAYINALHANGGTMMADAVESVTRTPADGHRLRIVTFMTDGYVGNDFAILDLVQRLRGTSRWFPFGTGNAVNRFLIDGMARYGGGEAEYVLLNSPGDEVARRFYERISSPVLTDVSLEFRNLDVEQVFPNQVSDVWADRPLVIHARYRKAGRGRVILHGYREGRPHRQELRVRLPRRDERNSALASMWARARVDDLMGRDLQGVQTGQIDRRLQEEIVQVALEHRILTPFTSFVAVEDRVVNENGTLRTVEVPVEMPQGVAYEGIFGENSADASGLAGLAGRAAKRMARQSPGIAGYAEFALRDPREVMTEPPPQAPEDGTLSAMLRQRLAPALIALFEGTGPINPGLEIRDGRVKVEVTFRSGVSGEALQRAGLDVLLLTERHAVGWIEVGRLDRLAGVEGVEQVDAP